MTYNKVAGHVTSKRRKGHRRASSGIKLPHCPSCREIELIIDDDFRKKFPELSHLHSISIVEVDK